MSFVLLHRSTPSQTHPGAAAVLVDEFDPCILNRRANIFRGAFSTTKFTLGNSSLAIVGSEMPERFAKSAWDHPSKARAAFT